MFRARQGLLATQCAKHYLVRVLLICSSVGHSNEVIWSDESSLCVSHHFHAHPVSYLSYGLCRLFLACLPWFSEQQSRLRWGCGLRCACSQFLSAILSVSCDLVRGHGTLLISREWDVTERGSPVPLRPKHVQCHSCERIFGALGLISDQMIFTLLNATLSRFALVSALSPLFMHHRFNIIIIFSILFL